MKIFLASDHQGFELKHELFGYLSKNGYDVQDVGNQTLDANDDYPQFAQMAALKVLGEEDPDTRAILVCGGGQGMAIAANRFRGIRAVVVGDAHEAKMSRVDNDANVLTLSAQQLNDEPEAAHGIVETWLNTKFSGAARHQRRIKEIDEIYGD
ncbi:MAG TPA: RpiB/LacA/LacB family sugar-phosphate isomerase [Candidatus Saccharimonadales bacterium]|jgi:ribose 5-phosphate isomerase B